MKLKNSTSPGSRGRYWRAHWVRVSAATMPSIVTPTANRTRGQVPVAPPDCRRPATEGAPRMMTAVPARQSVKMNARVPRQSRSFRACLRIAAHPANPKNMPP